MAKYVFGIDLGTTYSCIAYVDETGRATVVNNKEGRTTTPSVVNFSSSSSVVVGQVAKETAVLEPESTISLVKSLMGKTNVATAYESVDLSPEEISSYILRKVVSDAEELLNTKIQDVVITCPAYFGTAERIATKNAGIIAGLNVIEVISEPTAAALYYGCVKSEKEKTVLVYDLGGGTFDVTVMRVAEGEIEVICSDGDHDLGGKNWDNALMSYLVEQYREISGEDFDLDEFSQQDLAIKVETAKMQLTARKEVPIVLESGGNRLRVKVSREIFEEITEVLLAETVNKANDAIAFTKEKGFEIDEILLVGGSTKMPQVAEIIQKTYGIVPKVLEPDEAVAKGAAIYALGAYEAKFNQWKEKINDGFAKLDIAEAEKYSEEVAVSSDVIPCLRGKKIDEVVTVATTKSYGLEVEKEGVDLCKNLILKNIPLENGRIVVEGTFGTFEANQSCVELIVYESDSTQQYFELDEDFILGTATLELPNKNLPAKSPIKVVFSLNNEGILRVIGTDLTTGTEIQANMQTATGGFMEMETLKATKEKSKKITVE